MTSLRCLDDVTGQRGNSHTSHFRFCRMLITKPAHPVSHVVSRFGRRKAYDMLQ